MPKRARSAHSDLRSVMNIRGVSKSALFDIVSRLGGEEAPVSEWQFRKASQQRYEEVHQLLEMPAAEGAGKVDWHLCHPLKTLDLLLRDNDTLQGWYLSALQRHPCSAATPWRILLGWDEFVPGNKLAIDNSRKTMCLSFTFDELDEQRDLDLAWITPIAVRNSLVKSVRGGWSNMLRAFLHLLLLDDGQGLQAAGHPLLLRGSTHMLFARVDLMMADGDGLRLALQWLGAGAVKPCFRHWNVLKRQSPLLDHDPRRLYVDTTCADPGRFQRWSTAELGTAADVCVAAQEKCEANEIPRARCTEIERGFGYRITSDGLLADRVLRRHVDFCEVVHYDWVHTLLEDSAITRESWELLQACDAAGLPGSDHFRAFLAQKWRAPREPGENPKRRRAARDLSQLATLFDAESRKYQDERGAVKCAASDWFTLHALMRLWVLSNTTSDPRIDQLRRCVLLGLDCIGVVIAAKRRRIPRARAGEQFLDMVKRHMTSHVEALGPDTVKPKLSATARGRPLLRVRSLYHGSIKDPNTSERGKP